MNKYQIGVGPRWVAALTAAETEDPGKPKEDPRRHAQLEAELATAKARIDTLEEKNRELTGRLERIAALAAAGPVSTPDAEALPELPRAKIQEKAVRTLRVVTTNGAPVAGDSLHSAARKLLIALAQHAPARFTWGQAATLAGLKPILSQRRLGQDCPSKEEWGQPHSKVWMAG